jgi:hypothetical protein
MINWVGKWEVTAAPGLTDTGAFHKLQTETVSRLKSLGNTYVGRTLETLKATVETTYTEGTGVTKQSLRVRSTGSSDQGFGFEFLAGGRALVFLTAMAGLPIASPGHLIPHAGVSRFYWRSQGRWAMFTPQHPAKWRTRQGRDVITEVLNAGAQQFAQAMIAEHNTILVNFVQTDLRTPSKSPRVNTAAGSGIEPQ